MRFGEHLWVPLRLINGWLLRGARPLAGVAARAEGCDARDLGVVIDRAIHSAVARRLRSGGDDGGFCRTLVTSRNASMPSTHPL